MTGEELKAIREELGWTQSQMADELGVTPNTVARWERGEMEIFEPAARLAMILARGTKGRGSMSLFEKFIQESLSAFEQHLRAEGIAGALEDRMRGAREFALLLLGRPHKRGQRTKGSI
jgi:transcriptional regulator with XRE-family HTH domain